MSPGHCRAALDFPTPAPLRSDALSPGRSSFWFPSRSRLRALVLVGFFSKSGLAATDPEISSEASAATQRWLIVERSSAAGSCPSEPALQRQAEGLIDHDPPLIRVRVRFSRSNQGFSAEISRDGQEGVRKLSDTHHDCTPLASAVATAVALLVDAEAPPALPPVSPYIPSEKPPPLPLPVPDPEPQRFIGGHLAILGTAAVIQDLRGGLAGELYFTTGRLRVALGGLGLLSRTTEYDPGRIRHSLVALTTRACVRMLGAARIHLSGCSGWFVGAVRAEASGFTRNHQELTAWSAVPLELAVGGRWSKSREFAPGWRLGGGALVPLRKQTYRVEGLGDAFSTPALGGAIWAAIEGSWGF